MGLCMVWSRVGVDPDEDVRGGFQASWAVDVGPVRESLSAGREPLCYFSQPWKGHICDVQFRGGELSGMASVLL